MGSLDACWAREKNRVNCWRESASAILLALPDVFEIDSKIMLCYMKE